MTTKGLVHPIRSAGSQCSNGAVPIGSQCSNACFDNPSLTIFRTQSVLLHNTCDFSHTNNTAVRKSAVSVATRLHSLLNNCVLLALVKLAFVALLSCNILWFGSRVAFTSRAVNTIMQKGCGHLLASMTAKH